jgi:hypothetical protein
MKKFIWILFIVLLSCEKKEKAIEDKWTPEETFNILIEGFNTSKYKDVKALYIQDLIKMQKDSISDELKEKLIKTIDSLQTVLISLPETKPIDLVDKQSIEKQFSNYDGSHINLEKYILNNMNNPKSYEHVDTGYKLFDDYLLVITRFRGTNAYGGVVIQEIKAKCSLYDGTVIEILN